MHLELARELAQADRVHPDPVALHAREHPDQGPLDVLVERLKPHLLERARLHRPEIPDPPGPRAGPRDAGPLAQQLGADLLELVVGARRVQEIGGHRGVLDRGQRAAAGQPPLDEGLDVVADQRPPVESREQRRGDLRAPAFNHRFTGPRVIQTDRRDDGLRRPSRADHIHRERLARGRLGQIRRERVRVGQGRHLAAGGLGRGLRGELAQQAVELELGPERPQALPVGLAPPEGLQVHRDRHPRADRRQLAGEQRLLAVNGERLAQLARHQREVLVEALHAAELPDQLDRGLLADPRHPRDVVDGIAHEGQDVGDLCRLDAPLGLHRGLVEDHAVPAPAGGRVHAHPRAHELEHVLVGGDQDDLDQQVSRAIHHRAQHVVGLEARHLQERQAQRFEEGLHQRDLASEIVGRGRPRLLVGRELLFPERRAGWIPRHREVLGVVLPQELPQHGGHAEDRVARHPLRGGEKRNRVVGAKEEAGAVQDEQTLGHAGSPRIIHRPPGDRLSRAFNIHTLG
jgi:hypothetical protein